MSALSAEERRRQVAALLRRSGIPVSAGTLARNFSVSRQIIVGDIALLRAAGADITATPRGYLAGPGGGTGILRTVACCHRPEDIGPELYAIVDAGGEAIDVIVEHPVYGQIAGVLRVRTRGDVEEFLRRVDRHGAKPLSALTNGIHLHTIRSPDEITCQKVLKALETQGFLLNM